MEFKVPRTNKKLTAGALCVLAVVFILNSCLNAGIIAGCVWGIVKVLGVNYSFMKLFIVGLLSDILFKWISK